MKWEIIKKFSAENKGCFSYKDVITEYPDKDHSHLSKVIAAMVRMGMLMKLSRDIYHIIVMDGSGSAQACILALITYSSQGCPDDENRRATMFQYFSIISYARPNTAWLYSVKRLTRR